MIGAPGSLYQALTRRGHQVRFAATGTGSQTWSGLARGQWDACIISGYRATDEEIDSLRRARELQPHLAILVSCADEDLARRLAMRVDADDWTGPDDVRSIAAKVTTAVASRRWTPHRRAPDERRPRGHDGFAHQINNPATYVVANLTAMRRALTELRRRSRRGQRDEHDLSLLQDVTGMVDECLDGMHRINSATNRFRPAALGSTREWSDLRVALARRSAAPDSAPAEPASGKSQTRRRTLPARRLRLLVVDDEPLILRSVARMLADHDVETAHGGNEALATLAENRHYDLILCDLMMPEIDGRMVYQSVREHAPELLPRIVFFSGGAYTDAARRFLKRENPPLLQKPLTRAAFDRVARERVAGPLGAASHLGS